MIIFHINFNNINVISKKYTKKMNENKIKMKTILKSEEDIDIPFINSNEDNKTLNKLLYYVYDDDFVMMINELSTSILNYHKIISKCFVNIRILLNKMGQSPYLTAIEGNCSNLESSFKKFYSNAKVIFRKMKLYRNEKFNNINNNKDFHDLKNKNIEKKNGLTIIINNNNNNNIDDNNFKRNLGIGNYSHSPQQNNLHNVFNKKNYEQSEKNYIFEKEMFDFFQNIINLLIIEKNEKSTAINKIDDFYFNKNYVINRNNNSKMDFHEFININEKKIIAKIKYLLESKNKIETDIESIIEKSQKEKKEYKNQINSLKTKCEQIENEKEIINNKYLDKSNRILNEKEKYIIQLKENINELNDKIEKKDNELKIEQIRNKEIIEQKNNLSSLIKEKKNEILSLEEENENLHNDLEKAKKEFKEYKQKNSIEIKSKEEMISLNKKNKKEIERYKSEMNNIIKQNQELNSEIQLKIKKLELLEERNNKNKEELSLLKKENNNLINENKIKEKEIILLNDDKIENNLEIKNKEKVYQDELDKKEKLINEFNEKYNKLNELYFELCNKNNDNNKKIKEANNEIMNIKQENEKFKKELETKEEEYESIKDKYITLIENKSRDTKIFEKNKNKVLELEKEIKKKNIKLLEGQNEIDKNQEEINKYQSQINNLKNELKRKKDEISQLNIELNNQNRELDVNKKLIEQEKNKNKKLEEQYNQLLNTNKKNILSTSNQINFINNKLKVNTIDASRTKSANKTLNKNKNKFLIKTNDYSSESQDIILNNNIKNIIQTEYKINNNEIQNEQEIELTPENYIIVKCTELSSKLRWYLFKRKSPKNNNNSNLNNNAFIFTHLKSYFKNNKSYRNTLNNNNSKNPELYDASYEDFIWKPFKNQKEFARFGELPISETKENFEIIEDLNKKISKLEENIIEKEKEYEILYINYNILNQKNKNYEEQDKFIETIDKLTKENEKLNELITKYKNEKNDEVGLSFIDNDLEGSKFLDDKGFEDIFSNLDNKKDLDKKNEINSTSKQKKINSKINEENDDNKIKDLNVNKHLKDSINLLMNQVNMNQNARSTFSSILIQLGFSDEDIYKIMGNYRGIISIGSKKI